MRSVEYVKEKHSMRFINHRKNISKQQRIIFIFAHIYEKSIIYKILPIEIIREIVKNIELPTMLYQELRYNEPTVIGGRGRKSEYFNDCMFCDIMPDGRLAVGDSDNRRLSIIDPDNKVPPKNIKSLSHTSGVAVIDENRIAVAEMTGHRIVIRHIDTESDSKGILNKVSILNDYKPNNDRDNYLFGGRSPRDFSNGGMTIDSNGNTSNIGYIWSICYDPVSETIFAADSSESRVVRFQVNHNSCTDLKSLKSLGQEFTRSVAVNIEMRLLYVAHTKAIGIFNIDTEKYLGTFLECDGENGLIDDVNRLAVDPDGNVIVTMEGFGGCVRIFSKNKELLHEIVSFNYPCGVSIDKKGQRLFVCERRKDVIYMFSI